MNEKVREHSSDAVVSRLNAQFQSLKEAQVFSFQPAMIPGYGMGNSLELNLQDMTGVIWLRSTKWLYSSSVL